jgi:hypothetical protein
VDVSVVDEGVSTARARIVDATARRSMLEIVTVSLDRDERDEEEITGVGRSSPPVARGSRSAGELTSCDRDAARDSRRDTHPTLLCESQSRVGNWRVVDALADVLG